METIQHLTPDMVIAFILGIGSLFLYAWKTTVEHNRGYGVKRYMTLTLANISFHIVSSFMLFLGLHEVGEIIIKNYIPFLEESKTYHYTLAALTGMFGSVLIAFIFEKAAKYRNKKDTNINHVHGPDCKHN